MVWETEEDIESKVRKLKAETSGNDSLSHEHKEEINFHKSKDLLTSTILNIIV